MFIVPSGRDESKDKGLVFSQSIRTRDSNLKDMEILVPFRSYKTLTPSPWCVDEALKVRRHSLVSIELISSQDKSLYKGSHFPKEN